MFYSLKGTLTHIEPNAAVIECGGVGFLCLTTASTLRALPAVGQSATLYTHLNVREDALDLFGFATQSELNCFRTLTSVSGVGPKAALSILSSLAPEQLAMAVGSGDYKSLTRAPGIGPKLAQRIVLELKDKVKKLNAERVGMPDFAPGGIPNAASNAAEAVNALTVLGYSPSEASAVVARFDSALPTEELIRQALRAMAARL